MSRRQIVRKFNVWTDLDSENPEPSISTVVQQVDNVIYVLEIDPTVSGVLEVEFCNEPDGQPEIWKPMDFGETLALNGAVDTDYEINISKHSRHKMRLNFTNGSGTGNISAWYASSSVGA